MRRRTVFLHDLSDFPLDLVHFKVAIDGLSSDRSEGVTSSFIRRYSAVNGALFALRGETRYSTCLIPGLIIVAIDKVLLLRLLFGHLVNLYKWLTFHFHLMKLHLVQIGHRDVS